MNNKLSDPDHVVSVIEEQDMPFASKTFLVQEFFAKVQAHTAIGDEWIKDGVKCRYLTPNGRWQQGKIKLELSFIPNRHEYEHEHEHEHEYEYEHEHEHEHGREYEWSRQWNFKV